MTTVLSKRIIFTCADSFFLCMHVYMSMPMFATALGISVMNVDIKNILILFNSKMTNTVLAQFKLDM
jgi:hypothetical protein